MVSAAHIGTSEVSGTDVSDPDEVPDSDPERRGTPVVLGIMSLSDVDLDDDDAIEEFARAVAKEYGDAVRAAGLKMAPPGTLVRKTGPRSLRGNTHK